jgi:hypothetical protein
VELALDPADPAALVLLLLVLLDELHAAAPASSAKASATLPAAPHRRPPGRIIFPSSV